MKSRISFLLGLSLLLIASSAHAAPQTWVSGVGDDSSLACIRTWPCRTFAKAISVTDRGGEISVLDPGDFRAVPPVSPVDFGPFTIDRSITINGNSIAEIIPGNGENGVTVNITTAGDPGVVILRGLSINGARNYSLPAPPETGGLNGVQFQAGGTLIIDHCIISGFQQNDIDVTSASGNLVVKDTTLTGGARGISLSSAATDAMRVQVTNCLIAENAVYGVHADGKGTISVVNSLLAKNGVAVQAETDATVRLSNSDILDNPTSICGRGTVASAGDNKNAPDPDLVRCRPATRVIRMTVF